MHATKFQLFSYNISRVSVGESPASFRESPLTKLYLGLPFLTFKWMYLKKYTLFPGMFGIKIIAETPAFRRRDKNFACQWPFKAHSVHITRVIYFHYISKTESLYCHTSGTDLEAHSVRITLVNYFHFNSKTESLYCKTSETGFEAHSVHITRVIYFL